MSSLPALAITGSTGVLGGLVAHDLAERGLEQRLLVRDVAAAPVLDGATAVGFVSYGDGASAARALEGATTLLMVSGSESADRLEQHRTFVDAAAEAGVRHLVYTSFFGASADCAFTLGRDHFATEQHVRASGMDHTFLRDNFYLDFLPLMAGEDGVLRGPAGDGRVSAVARADIARAAVAVLLDPVAHANRTYDLTGPEAISLAEAARIISETTGRNVTYHDESVEEAYESRRRQWPAPEWQYDAWVSTYTAIARGEVAGVSDDIAALTGRRPLGLAELLANAPG